MNKNQYKALSYCEMQRELSTDIYKVFERLKAGWKEKSEVEAAMKAEGFVVLEQPPLLPRKLIDILSEETSSNWQS